MTPKEAIASLKTLCNTCTMFPRCVNNKPECFQAIEMAIFALEKQEQVVDASCETCKYKNRSGNTYPCFGCFRASDQDDYYEPYTEGES